MGGCINGGGNGVLASRSAGAHRSTGIFSTLGSSVLKDWFWGIRPWSSTIRHGSTGTAFCYILLVNIGLLPRACAKSRALGCTLFISCTYILLSTFNTTPLVLGRNGTRGIYEDDFLLTNVVGWGGTVPTMWTHVSQLTALLRVCIFNQLLEGEVEEVVVKYGRAIIVLTQIRNGWGGDFFWVVQLGKRICFEGLIAT